MNSKVLVVLIAVCCLVVVPFLMVSDSSDATDLPSCDESYQLVNKTYYTNSSSESYSLNDLSGNYAYIIGASYMQGNLTVDTSGCPSWITYQCYSSRYDVTFTISPGAVCDDTYWMLFSCFGGSANILITFDITVLDSGSVIPDTNYKTFVLKLDTNGGSQFSDIAYQSTISTHTFDLSDVTPTRDGYTFKGWSDSSAGLTLIVSNVWTLTITDDSDSIQDTLYAVWEKNQEGGLTIYTVWDDIVELFSEPLVDIFVIIVGLGVALFIRSRRY